MSHIISDNREKRLDRRLPLHRLDDDNEEGMDDREYPAECCVHCGTLSPLAPFPVDTASATPLSGGRGDGKGGERKSAVIWFSENSVSLAKCRECKRSIDEYVEFEFVLIVLDLLLHRVSAFRHLVWNRPIPDSLLYRFAAFTIILDIFFVSGWISKDILVLYGGYSLLKSLVKFFVYNAVSWVGYRLASFASSDVLHAEDTTEPGIKRRAFMRAQIISRFPLLMGLVATAWAYPLEFKFVIVFHAVTAHAIALFALTNRFYASVFIAVVASLFSDVLVEAWA